MKNLIICGLIASSFAFFTANTSTEQREENLVKIEFVKDKLGNVNVKLWNKSKNKLDIADRPDRSSANFSINASTTRTISLSEGTKLYWLKAKTPFLTVTAAMDGVEQIIAR